MFDHDLSRAQPDYAGGSIVNLMATIANTLGDTDTAYPPLRREVAPGFECGERVVLLVIDGLGADLLQQLAAHTGSRGLQSACGGRLTSVFPPTTATAITTYMTGEAPQQHALTGWFMHFREIGVVSAVLPFVTRAGHIDLGNNGVELASLVDRQPFCDRLPCDSVMLLPADIADSRFSRLLGGRARREPYNSLDHFVALLEQTMHGAGERQFVYAYWSELDHLAHIYGPSSDQVAAHFAELDRALTPLLEVARAAGNSLIVTADHGFIDIGADDYIEFEEHPVLQRALSTPLFGEPRTAFCHVRAAAQREFEHYVEQELAHAIDLVPSANLIADGWFGEGEPHPELHARVGDYALQMRERYVVRDRLAGERPFQLRGVHGGCAAAEQYVPLIHV